MVPVVMSDGKVKPPELMYSEESKTYVPLTEDWMSEIGNPDSSYLGKSAKAPSTLSSDMDVRAITLPPSTGRFVYASYSKTDLLTNIDNSDNIKKNIHVLFPIETLQKLYHVMHCIALRSLSSGPTWPYRAF